MIIDKYNWKIKFKPVNASMVKKLQLAESLKDFSKTFSTGFCISMIHQGVNIVTENILLENYNKAIKGKQISGPKAKMYFFALNIA